MLNSLLRKKLGKFPEKAASVFRKRRQLLPITWEVFKRKFHNSHIHLVVREIL